MKESLTALCLATARGHQGASSHQMTGCSPSPAGGLAASVTAGSLDEIQRAAALPGRVLGFLGGMNLVDERVDLFTVVGPV